MNVSESEETGENWATLRKSMHLDQVKPVSHLLLQTHSNEIVNFVDFCELERICDVRILENKKSDVISKNKQEIYMSQIYKLVSLKSLLGKSLKRLSTL